MSRFEKRGEPTDVEREVEGVFNEFLSSQPDQSLRSHLNNLRFASAKVVDHTNGKILVIAVPYKQIGPFHQVQIQLVQELEKRLSRYVCVVLVGKRRAFPKTPKRHFRFKAIRPVSRTVRAVHDAFLEDVVYPSSIVGKRLHYDQSGEQTYFVYLDAHEKGRIEERLPWYAAAYHDLTGQAVTLAIADH